MENKTIKIFLMIFICLIVLVSFRIAKAGWGSEPEDPVVEDPVVEDPVVEDPVVEDPVVEVMKTCYYKECDRNACRRKSYRSTVCDKKSECTEHSDCKCTCNVCRRVGFLGFGGWGCGLQAFEYEDGDCPCDDTCYTDPRCGGSAPPDVEPECGDGILHTELGEECDDGNTDDGDGCSSGCQIEEEEEEITCTKNNVGNEYDDVKCSVSKPSCGYVVLSGYTCLNEGEECWGHKPSSPIPVPPPVCIKEGESGLPPLVCCKGLKNVGNSKPVNGVCTSYKNPSFVCTNCGDGNCGLGENYCNCPEDCKKEESCVKEGEKGSTTNSNPDDDVCCAGLEKIKDSVPIVYPGKGCSFVSAHSDFVCTKCGNGKCGLGENYCNCPEDCKKEECIGEGEVGLGFNNDFCCEGLKRVGNSRPANGRCISPTDSSFVCTDCGNGKCGLGENYCNCPEDCKEEESCVKEGEKGSMFDGNPDNDVCCAGLEK